MYESKSYRSASDISSWDSAQTANGTIKSFTFAPDASELPISPFTVQLFRNGLLVANDDGRGNIQGKDADAGLLHLLYYRDEGEKGIFRRNKYGHRETERKAGKGNRHPATTGKSTA